MGVVVSMKPVMLTDLRLRISYPQDGRDLPVIVFSHGYGSSLEAYGPLTDYWAAHGFAVIQPTHLDSRTVGLADGDPRTPDIWRIRVSEVVRILDNLDSLVSADHDRIAVAGHSFGGQTAGNLLGLRVEGSDLSDSRVKAGVLLATAGRGGADLSPFAAEHFPFMNPDFSAMETPALVVAGDRDDSPLTVRGPDWLTDPYFLSPGKKSLLTVFGAEHSLGGIPGHEAKETTDENPEMVSLIQRVTLAYLQDALEINHEAWQAIVPNPLGRLESK